MGFPMLLFFVLYRLKCTYNSVIIDLSVRILKKIKRQFIECLKKYLNQNIYNEWVKRLFRKEDGNMSIGMRKQVIANYVYNGLIFFVLILALTMYTVSISDYKESQAYNLELMGKLQKNQIEKHIEKEFSVISEITLDKELELILGNEFSTPPMIELGTRKLVERLQYLLHGRESIYKSLSIVDVERQRYIATTDYTVNGMLSSFYQGFTHQIKQNEGIAISQVFLTPRDDQTTVLLGKAMARKNDPDNPYVLLVEVNFPKLLEKVKEQVTVHHNKQISFLTTSLGDIIGVFGDASINIPPLKEKYLDETIIAKINSGKENVEAFKGHSGQKVLGYYSQIPDSKWGIVIEQNQKDLYSFMLNQALSYSTIILIICIGLFLLKRYYHQQMYDYAREFEGIVKAISEGKDDIDLNRTGYEKIDSLYEAFGKLRKNLKHQKEKQDIILKIANTLAINIELEKLLEELLPNVIEGTKSHWGAFYIMNPITGKLEIKASRGLSKNVYKEFDVNIGEGLVGQAALDHKIKIIRDIPIDTVYVARTFLGKIKPKSIMTVPILFQGSMMGILILSSIYNYKEEQVDIMKVIRYYLGVAISNGLTYERTQRLSKELKFQNQLIQNMHDELEDKVRERTDFLDNIINSIRDYSIISLDKDGFITTWNKGAELLKGYKAEEVIGDHISILYSSEEVQKGKVENQLEVAVEKGQYVEYGWRIKKDGEVFFADTIITPMYDDHNNLIGFTNITKDITVTKNMEEALMQEKDLNHLLLETSEEALILLDREGVILKVNPTLERAIGYTADDLEGRFFKDYFEQPKEIIEGLQDIMKRGSRIEWFVQIRLQGRPERPVGVPRLEGRWRSNRSCCP